MATLQQSSERTSVQGFTTGGSTSEILLARNYRPFARFPGGSAARIVSLTGLGNGKSHRRDQRLTVEGTRAQPHVNGRRAAGQRPLPDDGVANEPQQTTVGALLRGGTRGTHSRAHMAVSRSATAAPPPLANWRARSSRSERCGS